MKRLAATLLGALTVLTAPAAQAGSYNFTIEGHRFRVEAPRKCRSMSCVSISTDQNVRPFGDADTTTASPPAPAPAPVAQAPQPVSPAASVQPPPAPVTAPPPAPPAPVLAATNSRPVVPPPAPKLEPPKFEALSPNPPRVDLSRKDTPVVVPQSDQTVGTAPRGDDAPAYMPLGEWESDGAKSADKCPVRIERCGTALCGYALTETSTRGENVLVNMKQTAHDVWTGNVFSRSSGDTQYGTMTLKSSGKLYVEACAIGHFWCSGNDWIRVEEAQEKLTTTWR